MKSKSRRAVRKPIARMNARSAVRKAKKKVRRVARSARRRVRAVKREARSAIRGTAKNLRAATREAEKVADELVTATAARVEQAAVAVDQSMAETRPSPSSASTQAA